MQPSAVAQTHGDKDYDAKILLSQELLHKNPPSVKVLRKSLDHGDQFCLPVSASPSAFSVSLLQMSAFTVATLTDEHATSLKHALSLRVK